MQSYFIDTVKLRQALYPRAPSADNIDEPMLWPTSPHYLNEPTPQPPHLETSLKAG